MRVFFATISMLFFAFDAWTQNSRENSFDDRVTCETKNRGVWREFGDVCVDDCEPKFNKLKICNHTIKFSCDCGAGRCWIGKKCIPIIKYKKAYMENFDKEQVKLKKAQRDREFDAERNSAMITKKLVDNARGRATSLTIKGARNNYSDFYNQIVGGVANSEIVQDVSIAVREGGRRIEDVDEDLPPIPMAPPIEIEGGEVKIPPAFLEQEEKSKKLNEEKSKVKSKSNEEDFPLMPII